MKHTKNIIIRTTVKKIYETKQTLQLWGAATKGYANLCILAKNLRLFLCILAFLQFKCLILSGKYVSLQSKVNRNTKWSKDNILPDK